jgi:hypothetical protein
MVTLTHTLLVFIGVMSIVAFVLSIIAYHNSTNDSSNNIMIGANSTQGGVPGLVPEPFLGDQDKFLGGDALWKSIVIPSVIEPEDPNNIDSVNYFDTDVFTLNANVTLVGTPYFKRRGDVATLLLAFTVGPGTLAQGESILSWAAGSFTATETGDNIRLMTTFRDAGDTPSGTSTISAPGNLLIWSLGNAAPLPVNGYTINGTFAVQGTI